MALKYAINEFQGGLSEEDAFAAALALSAENDEEDKQAIPSDEELLELAARGFDRKQTDQDRRILEDALLAQRTQDEEDARIAAFEADRKFAEQIALEDFQRAKRETPCAPRVAAPRAAAPRQEEKKHAKAAPAMDEAHRARLARFGREDATGQAPGAKPSYSQLDRIAAQAAEMAAERMKRRQIVGGVIQPKRK